MDERQEAKLIFKAIHELGIDVPVMSTRIVGNRVELYLYGGQVKVYTPPEMAVLQEAGDCATAQLSPSPDMAGRAVDRDPATLETAIGSGFTSPVKAGSSIADYLHPGIRDLESMSLVALRDLAKRWKVPGWNRLGKAKLIEALRNARA